MKKVTPISAAKQQFKGERKLIRQIENLPPGFYEPQDWGDQTAYYTLYYYGQLLFWCPLCLKWHIHGGGNGGIKDYGTRSSHCICEERPRFYTLLKWMGVD